jgi:2-keto-4-pentenoate hydratase
MMTCCAARTSPHQQSCIAKLRGAPVIVDQQSADVIMGNLMNAVLWIVRNQHARGVRLVAGDRLGLGAMSRIRPTPGLHIATIWEGFTPESATVEAVFR